MRRYIENLRTKPDHTKKQIAFAVSSLFFIGIATIWISTFSVRFPGLVLNSEANTTSSSQTASVSTATSEETSYEQLRRQLERDYVEIENISNSQEQTISGGVIISDPEL